MGQAVRSRQARCSPSLGPSCAGLTRASIFLAKESEGGGIAGSSPAMTNLTLPPIVVSGCRRDRDPDHDCPCCPCRWFREFAGRARSRRGRARPPCCPARACADRGHNRMLRDGRAPSPCLAYVVQARAPGSSFARSRARSYRSVAPPPRRRSRICSWRVAPSVRPFPLRNVGCSALLARHGPTPGAARRSVGETENCACVRKSGFDEAYCGTTWTVQNLGLSAQGVGRAHVAHARRHKNDMHEERTHETQSQTVFDRRGNRHRLVAGGRASAVARPDRRRPRQPRPPPPGRPGANGPEAGVWVSAETTDLPTRYAKIVVTDDQGRYVLPDLPKAKYKVWVRGYGLVDSPKVDGEPGQQLNLRAVPAPNEAAAAQYYPAIYWDSMLQIPDTGEF